MGEIIDVRNPVFAGQVFAEMLAGICHEEFYRYSDQEASTTTFPALSRSSIFHKQLLTSRPSQYSSPTPPSGCIMPSSLNLIFNLSTIQVPSIKISNFPPQNYTMYVILMSAVSDWTC